MGNEVYIFTDAAVRSNEAAIAWTSSDAHLLNGSRKISNTCGLVLEKNSAQLVLEPRPLYQKFEALLLGY